MANSEPYPFSHAPRTALEVVIGQQLQDIAEMFLIDRRAKGLAWRSVKFYRNYLFAFVAFCHGNSLYQVQDIRPELLRQYLVSLGERYNPGGLHAVFRTLRAFFIWLEKEEILPDNWKNPIRKVDAPRVPKEVIEPISLIDVNALLLTCNRRLSTDKRDKAIFLTLLDTGARAQELCDINLEDVDLSAKSIMIRRGKGSKPRVVFIGKKTYKALLAYLRQRTDQSPALFSSANEDRLTYDGLRQILRRRSSYAGLRKEPTLHDFRRAFALNMLRNGAEIFSLQLLMGHSDITMLRRYLAQSNNDIRLAHLKGSPVDHSLQEVYR